MIWYNIVLFTVICSCSFVIPSKYCGIAEPNFSLFLLFLFGSNYETKTEKKVQDTELNIDRNI